MITIAETLINKFLSKKKKKKKKKKKRKSTSHEPQVAS